MYHYYNTVIKLGIVLFTGFCLQVSNSHPTNQIRIRRNEIQYPNGTIVGTYAYKDKEGNPIAVKYFADSSGYGVELNSLKTFKIADSNSTPKSMVQSLKSSAKMSLQTMKPLLALASEIMNFDYKMNKETTTDREALKKDAGIFNNFDDKILTLSKYTAPDYDTFYQNEVKAPKQCEKDKVRVYLAKEKRKVRNVIEDFVNGR